MARPDRHRNMVLATDTLPLDTSNLRYDYSQIQDEHRQRVIEAAVGIRQQAARASESIIRIGKYLLSVKDFLPHGQFSAWIETEFELSQRMATNMMNAAREYGDEANRKRVSDFSPSALYLLAAPSTPPEVRDVVEKQALSTGRSPTRAEIKRIKREMEPQPLPPAKVVYVEPEVKPTAKDPLVTVLIEAESDSVAFHQALREASVEQLTTALQKTPTTDKWRYYRIGNRRQLLISAQDVAAMERSLRLRKYLEFDDTAIAEKPTAEEFDELISRQEETAKRLDAKVVGAGDGIAYQPSPPLGRPVVQPNPRVTKAQSLRHLLQLARDAAQSDYTNLTGIDYHVDQLERAIAPMIEQLNQAIESPEE